ncbi:hypothetical protein [Streptomyces sp. ODS28]|uniref:hypothetical protein n=1 Tax=Streptomyces sp. ODS28 TaxID=3136688 RepID=UPI0031E751CF
MAAAAQSAMSAHRRALATAAAAGSVLLALCFVPSAKATPETGGARTNGAGTVTMEHGAHHPGASPASATSAAPADPGTGRAGLAETGGFDSAPYVVGGLGFLGAGGVLVARSLRSA